MSIKSPLRSSSLFLGCLSLGLVLNPVAGAVSAVDTAVNLRADTLVLFEPPTDDRVDDSRGGASRPAEVKCIRDRSYALPLTALIPQSGVGLTVEPHPTLMVYVPTTTATHAHLTLRDADTRGLYQSRIKIPQTGGVLQIQLPADSPELAVDETYGWSLALLCQPTQTDMPIASGQIRRVELSDDVQEPSSLLAQASIYGQFGVWHDMLATLATLRQSQPDDQELVASWVQVLQAENLGAIANTPFLN